MLSETTRRRAFPGLEGMHYLNTAAEGIPPVAVGEALAAYFRDKQRGMDGREAHFAQLEAAKALTGRLYGLTADEVSICSSSSEAFNLAALALRLKDGDEVVINDLDFPAGATPWLQESCPATVRVWRSRDGALRVEDLVGLLGPRTRLVTTSLVSFFNGFLVPLAAVVDAVKRHCPAPGRGRRHAGAGADPAGPGGRRPDRQQHAQVDPGQSWRRPGGRPRRAAPTPGTCRRGGGSTSQDAFGAERFERAVSRPGAAGFAVGMPNFPAIYAIRAGLEYIADVGVARIDEAARPLVLACLEGLAALPVELLTPRRGDALAGILAFRHPEAEAIRRHLRSKDIHVMSHAGRLRVALHGYNTAADVEAFLRELDHALRL